MMKAVINSLEIPVIQNLNELTIALEQGKKKYDQIVFTVPDPKIRKSLLSIERQSSEYAEELIAQIKKMGGDFQPNPAVCMVDSLENRVKNIEKEVLQICRRIERSIIRLYGKMLKDPIVTDQLRDLIRSQMIGIMGSMQHLKLLTKLLYTQ
jgi:hypothetical protein